MPTIVPSFYPRFRCIPSACHHSCCVDWEIGIDEDSLARYRTRTDALGERIRMHIIDDDDPHFALCEDNRCPFLEESGLCSIILAEGQGTLPEICREHPRFRNFYGEDYIELSTGLSCELAIQLLLKEENLHFLVSDIEIDALTPSESLSLTPYSFSPIFSEYENTFLEKKYTILQLILEGKASYDTLCQNIFEYLSIHNYKENARRAYQMLPSIDTMNADFSKLFNGSKAEISHVAQSNMPLINIEKKNLLAHTFFRHANTENLVSLEAVFAFSHFFVSLISELIECRNFDKIEAIRTLSAEIEYSEENTDRLLEVFDDF